MDQHWSKVWLDLKADRPEESLGILALKKTQAFSTGMLTAYGQLGSVTSTPNPKP